MISKDKHLDYSNQKLTEADLPRVWQEAQAQGIEFLDLSKNHFAQISFPSYALPKLKVLELSYNQAEIAEIVFPKGIFDNLMYLYLYKSKLQKITFTAGLPHLDTLHLAGNQLRVFEELPLGFDALQTLYLYKNPIEDTFIRGFLEDGKSCLSFIRDYYKPGVELIIDNERKLLLIGNGKVGKSCLVERLVNDRFEPDWKSTHAVSIEQYPKHPHQSFQYLLNLWDFGGQDIYHATHRLFMQSNAIYLLCWDWETEYSPQTKCIENDIERSYDNHSLAYWLAYSQSQGEGSPLIVVQTKAGIHGEQDPKEKSILKERYKAILSSFRSIESSEKDMDINGYNDLLSDIRKAIKKVKTGIEIPKYAFDLRQALRNKQKEGIKEISFQEYEKLAGDCQIKNDGSTITPQSVLEKWLAKTGVVFYRQGLFQNKIILDQAWAIKAIYTLFDREGLYYDFLQNKKGQFLGADLHKVWGKDHQEAEQELFVSFMLSCELCFETTPKREGKENWHSPKLAERKFIAPQLLPDKKDDLISYVWKDRKSWYVKYTHDFLHYGIIQSFIVRTNYLAKVPNIWQKGIFLEEDSAMALIETQAKEIKVRITENGKNLLDKIRNLLADLQTDKVVESVSLNGEDYVLLENLKSHHHANMYIKAESGKDILFNDLRFFKEINKGDTFKIIETMNIVNPTIPKALKYLQNANYSGYFEEMDKVVPVNMQTPYQEHKGKFIADKVAWNFHQILETFAREVDKALAATNVKTINEIPDNKPEHKPMNNIPQSFIQDLKKQVEEQYKKIIRNRDLRNDEIDESLREKYAKEIALRQKNIKEIQDDFLNQVKAENSNLEEKEIISISDKVISAVKTELGVFKSEIKEHIDKSHQKLISEIVSQISAENVEIIQGMYDSMTKIEANEANKLIEKVSASLPATLPNQQEIKQQLNSIDVTVSSKLKLAIPIIPMLLSYEVDFGNQWADHIPKAWRSFVGLFVKK